MNEHLPPLYPRRSYGGRAPRLSNPAPYQVPKDTRVRSKRGGAKRKRRAGRRRTQWKSERLAMKQYRPRYAPSNDNQSIQVIHVGKRGNSNVKDKRTRTRQLINIPLTEKQRDPTTLNTRTIPNIYVLNAASIAKPHASEHLYADLSGHNVQIGFITETHLKQHHDEKVLSLPGYDIIRRDRERRKGGGVAIVIQNDLHYSQLGSSPHHEILWIKTSLNKVDYIIGVCYHPPKATYPQPILSYLETTITNYRNQYSNHTIILAGDFNELDDQQITESTGLIDIVKAPTRKDHHLDRIYTSEPMPMKVSVLKSTVKSDHQCILGLNEENRSAQLAVPKTKHHKKIRIRDPKNVARFHEHMSSNIMRPELKVEANDFQESINDFYFQLHTILDLFFPLKEITTTSRDPSFVTPYIKRLLRKKNHYMRKGKVNKANIIREEINSIIITNNSNKLKSSKPKEIWAELRNLTKKVEGRTRDNAPSANTLNEHYVEISTDRAYEEIPMKDSPSNNFNGHFDVYEIHMALSKLKKTATGADRLPSWFLRLATDYIYEPLTSLFNTSVQTGIVPEQWKLAIINPIPKIPKPTKPEHYRPISITPVLSRICERMIIKKYINKSIMESDLFTDQYAFRPTGSTTAALIAILKEITSVLETHKNVRLVALDFSKAFDTAKRSALFQNLSNMNIPDEIYNWMVNFYRNREQTTFMNEQCSEVSSINAGVVQGSVIGPSAFSIIVSDLKPSIKGNVIIKYADDTYLVVPPDNYDSTARELQQIKEWAMKKNLHLNEKKSKEIIFQRPRTNIQPPELPNITRSREITILGVTLTQKLHMDVHVNKILKKCNKSLYVMKIIRSRGVNRNILHQIYTTVVTNRLLYAAPSWWGFASANDKKRIEQYFKRGVRFGYAKPGNISETVVKMERRLFRKAMQNKTHTLHQQLPPETAHQRNLRPKHHRLLRTTLTGNNERTFINRMLHCDFH